MTFREILARIVDGTPGGLAGAIMGSDGIPLDEYAVSGTSLDLTAVAVEFQAMLEQADKAARALYPEAAQAVRELTLRTADHQLLFRPIDEEYSVVVAIEEAGSLGKARYLVRSVLHEISEEL
jgi:predicted regulator of Ras-like GTPase activity (Roadblock/LC7/MglB family)